MSKAKIIEHVESVAEQALATRQYVTAIDILTGLGWLAAPHVDLWRQGRVDFLESRVQANLSKISDAMHAFRNWAKIRGLNPSETAYVARTRDRRQLRFSKSGDPGIERNYRTHFISPQLPEKKAERLREKIAKQPDLLVILPIKEWQCKACARGEGFLIMEDGGPLCMRCAKLDHLVFLPSGDPKVTRAAKSLSSLAAVVVRFSRTRGRYERQGLLVEPSALEAAQGG